MEVASNVGFGVLSNTLGVLTVDLGMYFRREVVSDMSGFFRVSPEPHFKLSLSISPFACKRRSSTKSTNSEFLICFAPARCIIQLLQFPTLEDHTLFDASNISSYNIVIFCLHTKQKVNTAFDLFSI